MKINILTLFPDMFEGFANHSIEKRAIEAKKLALNVYNIRDYSKNKHGKVDDTPFGGGAGMVMTPQPLYDCFDDILSKSEPVKTVNVYMSPKGETIDETVLKSFLEFEQINVLCGHYEGVDQRVIDTYIDREISIGDYILTGGELAAMVFIDATIRFIPGVLGNETSALDESFSNGLLEHPQYTRPSEFRGEKVPDVLLSGDHKKIEAYRKSESIEMTKKMRPDLLDQS
jgi:tRNA (guanine37-N1)-methyltransferase